MFRRALILVALVGLFAAPEASAGRVGGPPTMDFDRCDEFIEPCGEPIVVGTARFFDGRYEWVAMKVREGVCFYTEVINRTGGSGSGGCGPGVKPPQGEALYSGWSGPESGPGARAPKATHVGGPVRLDAAEVRVSFRKRGELRRRQAALIRVEGALAEQVGLERPFAYWGRSIPGCVPGELIRARAFDASGGFLGSAQPPTFARCGSRR